ncbi:MAG TPA: glycoside hydrolase family 18 protein [Candidatus Dormibacteraeota bacterium]
MKRTSMVRAALSALLAGALLLTTAPAAGAGQEATERDGAGLQRVAYFIQWGIYARAYLVRNVADSGQAARLSTINYAFAGVSQTGACTSLDTWADFQRPFAAAESVDGVADAPGQALLGNFNQLRKLKQRFPHLRVVMSLGGFTGSTFFSDVALTPASRQRFVASCVDMFLAGNLPGAAPGAAAGVFDGIDIDWEWPATAAAPGARARPEDRANFTLLVREFRRQLAALGGQTNRHLVLTAFLPADPVKIAAGFEVPAIFRSLDWATVQGYDLHGTWERTTNFQSALFSPRGDPSPEKFSIDLAVQTYLRNDAPARKLVLGVPFYSRGWTGVTNANHGLFQMSTGPAPATFEAGIEDFKVVAAKPGFTVFRDRPDGAAWLFDGSTFWTFDDPVALSEKMAYVTAHRLGGAMAWSLDADDAHASLVRAIDAGLRSAGE